jgi:ABC-type multidrug transport system fused ATPase/permease subunit
MEIRESANTVSSKYAIELCDAELTYVGNAEPSISGINLCVEHGETVGIIGSTGSGKTSLIHLIARFYDATHGSVLIDGKDVREMDPTKLHERIAIVPQKSVLFQGTVRSNLLWGNENATDEELWAALEAAQAKEFVMTKEGGLDVPVEVGGRNFSGGQRQRLAIARALVRGADILILDDASSALDYATDAALRHALRDLPNRPAVLIVSQRTASIRHADQILVLEDGESVGLGTHSELLSSCPVYREIHESQFQKGGEGA